MCARFFGRSAMVTRFGLIRVKVSVFGFVFNSWACTVDCGMEQKVDGFLQFLCKNSTTVFKFARLQLHQIGFFFGSSKFTSLIFLPFATRSGCS